MALNLCVVKQPVGVSLASPNLVFDEQGGSIGRGESNNWVLPDPERFLSSCHCRFSFEQGQFYLLDNSTNGTYLNGAAEPVGKGVQVPIKNADQIDLGDYQLTVEISSQPSAVAPQSAPVAQALDDPFTSSDPFAQPFNGGAAFPTSSAPSDDTGLFGDINSAASPSDDYFSAGSGLPMDSVFGSDSDTADQCNDPLAALDGVRSTGAPQADAFGGAPHSDDWLDAELGASNKPSAGAFDDFPSAPAGGAFGGGSVDDPLGLTPHSAPQLSQPDLSTTSDHGDAMGQALNFPEAKKESLIPDDWDDADLLGGDDLLSGGADELLGSQPGAQDSSSEAEFLKPTVGAGQADFARPIANVALQKGASIAAPDIAEPQFGGLDVSGKDDIFSQAATPATGFDAVPSISVPDQADKSPQAIPEDDYWSTNDDSIEVQSLPGDDFETGIGLGGAELGLSDTGRDGESGLAAQKTPEPRSAASQQFTPPRVARREPVRTQNPPTANKQPPAAPINPPAQRSSDHLHASVGAASSNALLDGLGLSERGLTGEQSEDIHRVIGELMPVIVQGMMQVLSSRENIKSEFRMNVTTIQPVENNPLKFSVGVDEAIDNLFVKKSTAFKPPVVAFQESFDRIGEHQIAVVAGVRAAFKGVVERFNPANLEKQFERQYKGLTMPGMQKARYWSSYVDYYTNLVEEAGNSFQSLFGDEFVQAYEEQLRKLAAEKRIK